MSAEKFRAIGFSFPEIFLLYLFVSFFDVIAI